MVDLQSREMYFENARYLEKNLWNVSQNCFSLAILKHKIQMYFENVFLMHVLSSFVWKILMYNTLVYFITCL